jgi:hypothetical protein
MPRRRLEDRIRDLCSRATEPEWPRILAELRLAIQEHTLRVANLTMTAVVTGQPHIIRERRDRLDAPFSIVLSGLPDDSRDCSVQ